MPATALSVFRQAEEELRAGRYAAALASYLRVVRSVPSFHRARFRIADTLLNLKARREALNVYAATAWHAMKSGEPLAALVAIKMAAALDPQQLAAIPVLAELYSKDSDRLTSAATSSRRLLCEKDPVTGVINLPEGRLIAVAAEEAADTSSVSVYPDKLPPVPLFSSLDERSFIEVLSCLQLRRFVKGNVIIEEGTPGDSFFIVAEGSVTVTRKNGAAVVSLARLQTGAVFGEMALISRAPRTATVMANDDCELLELKRASLEAQASKLAGVTHALKEFTRRRFLSNLVATSPLFRSLPPSMRGEVIDQFKEVPVEPGDEIIVEGEAGQGLFLILKGQIAVSKLTPDGSRVDLATLRESDVFGEISLVQDTPTTATCRAKTRSELLLLPKKEFLSTVARHPALKAELSRITAERLQQTQAIVDSATIELVEDDDLIML